MTFVECMERRDLRMYEFFGYVFGMLDGDININSKEKLQSILEKIDEINNINALERSQIDA